MSGSLENVVDLAVGLTKAASRRKSIGKSLTKKGFAPIGKGAWLGFRGRDVVSGLLIEGSASDIYLSSFILPIFDDISFVSWSLGRRIVHCLKNGDAEVELKQAIDAYSDEIFQIRSADELINYIDDTKICGFYAIWTKYICYLRVSNLKFARMYLDFEKQSSLHFSFSKRLTEINKPVEKEDVNGVAEILARWEMRSRKIFGKGEFAFDAS